MTQQDKDMHASNIPPFYAGQKVVAVDAIPGSRFKNGTQHTISVCERGQGQYSKYWYVGIVGWGDGKAYYRPGIFAPIEYAKASIMSFSKIKRIETKEILIEN